jgi:Uncharacterized protein containing SIS (Sugar ISomerase) phosphosugar binding domain
MALIGNKEYLNIVTGMLGNIENTQAANIDSAASIIKESIDNGGVLHAFSTGHSHMLVEEAFYRTGGLVPVNPIFDPPTMPHEGAVKSTNLERLPGYAKVIFDSCDLREGEPIIIMSNSGINVVPIEMAMLARERSMKVIIITSLDISRKASPRHPSGLRLCDLGDIVIDNCILGSDASIEIPETGQRIAAVSTIAGAYIIQRIVISTVNKYLIKGETPPIFMSANVEGGYEHNKALLDKYKHRIKGF